MSRLAATLCLGLVFVCACGPGGATGEDGVSASEPEWSACVGQEAQSCAEVCETQGMSCIQNGCPASPEFCDPEPCDMATQALALDAEALCMDASLGTFVASTCDAPVDWLFSNTLRCCCGDPL